MITLRRYSQDHKQMWDNFVEESKNGTFLHLRDYMDYHSDRFHDFSIMVWNDNKLLALLPACSLGDVWVSHAGLTYGGMLMNGKMTAALALEVFQTLLPNLRHRGFNQVRYSPSPHIYHRLPAEEDLYALFRCGASLSARKISSVVESAHPLKWRNIRKTGIRKAMSEGITIERSDNFVDFWEILSDNLANKYSAQPVHSLEEIVRLHDLFPDKILLYSANKGGKMLAGVVMYVMPTVAHCQYISANPEGKEVGALDLLFHHLLKEVYTDLPYFDFGTSNEDGGLYLNESLIYQKEGFGGRAICYDTYTLPLVHP